MALGTRILVFYTTVNQSMLSVYTVAKTSTQYWGVYLLVYDISTSVIMINDLFKYLVRLNS